MSYCVNCGVELATSEKFCPLCGVEVVNPRQPVPEEIWRPYPRREDPVIAQTNRRLVAIFVSIVIVLTMVICLLIDRSYEAVMNWSLYVAGALAMVWFWIVPGFLYHKPGYFKISLPISASLLGFLLLVEKLQAIRGWFLPVALPLVLLVTLLTDGLVFLGTRRILRGFTLPAAILAALGLLIIGVELTINHYFLSTWRISWSWFAALPCFALTAGSLAIARRQHIRSEIIKRLHI